MGAQLMRSLGDIALSRRINRSLQGAAVPGKETDAGSFFLPAIQTKGLQVGHVVNGMRRFVSVTG